jgi:hypothetical protein
MKNSRILVIGDLHLPYEHQDAFDFLGALKEEYKPDRVINIGDEIDGHAISMHDADPDLQSAGDEFNTALIGIRRMYDLFPRLDLIESNHGSLMFRRAKKHGIPRCYLRSYNDIYGVGKGWQWHFDLVVTPSYGPDVYLHHGKSANVLRLSQAMGMSAVQGHYHELFGAQWWGNPNALYFGAQTGCLVDHRSLAMAYGKNNLKRPVLGSLMIIDGVAKPVPMTLKSDHRWTGKL